MARSCTCKICKTKGNTDVFYKVTDDKGKNVYYCNQDEFEQNLNEKNKRKELLEYIAIEVLNYEEGQIVNPIMIKKINEMNKFYDLEVIQECFKVSLETIQYRMNTMNFTNEYGMVSYIMRIIEGNINDVFKRWKYEQRRVKKQEKPIEFLDTVNIDKINNINTVKKNDGIAAFLDEGDI